MRRIEGRMLKGDARLIEQHNAALISAQPLSEADIGPQRAKC